MTAPLKAPPVPCGSCPYRRDVPSGIWAEHEYDKLVAYDTITMAQPAGVFMCHQRDGCICGGWLACHPHTGPNALLALRYAEMKGELDESVYTYRTDVPLFSSGEEARAHGIKDIDEPGQKARKMVSGLVRKMKVKT